MMTLGLLAGCSDAGHVPLPGQRDPATTNWIDTRWRFAAIDDADPLVRSSGIAFEGDTLVIEAGCNRLAGPWRLEGDRLVAGPFTQTEVACPTASWRQGNAVTTLFAATPQISVDGARMTLKSSGHSARLTRVSD